MYYLWMYMYSVDILVCVGVATAWNLCFMLMHIMMNSVLMLTVHVYIKGPQYMKHGDAL